MMRGATILWAVLAAIAGTGLFMLKYEVQAQEQRLSGLHKDIIETQESIHVLKAEWSFLNEPGHLRELAERHLGMHAMKPSQVARFDSLPMADPRPPEQAAPQPSEAPIAEDMPETQAAPVATTPIPAAPVVQQQPAHAPEKPQVKPVTPPTKPQKMFTAQKAPAVKAAQTKLAQAKPAAPVPTAPVKVAAQAKPESKPAAVASAKSSYPSYPAYPTAYRATSPAAATTVSSGNVSGNVMVIKSPSMAVEPEMASTRSRP